LLHKRHPGLSLVLRSMSSPEIDAGLENLSVDLALGYTDRPKARGTRISLLAQYTERYFLLRRAANPSGSHLHIATHPTTWATAGHLPLCLLTPEMHNRTVVDSAFQQAGMNVNPVIQTNSILTLGLSVLVGEVSSILPGALVDVLRGYPELEAVPLIGPEVITPIGFMYATTDRRTHTLNAALDMAQDSDWLQQVSAHSGLLCTR
jgi:DNA-binding transcriptional LysR family regulator